MKLLVLAAAVIALPLTASAQRAISLHARTAGELAELCAANPREPGGDARINYCHGFAQGAADEVLMHEKLFCVPPGTPRDVVLHQFVDWVRESGEHRSMSAAAGITRFLAQRYPCH